MRIAPPDVLAVRVARLRALLAERGLDALIVTHLPNIAYLTGHFASSAALVVASDGLHLVADGRYAEALAARAAAFDEIRPLLIAPGAGYDDSVIAVLRDRRGIRVAVEAAHLTVQRHRLLAKALAMENEGAFDETTGLVESLRVVKDDWEIGRLRDAGGRLSELAKRMIVKRLAGRLERDVAAEIEAGLRRAGFERPAFDTIVAAGANAARPHGRAGGREIGSGDVVVMDFGGVLDGYCTDLTRTVTVGRPTARTRQVLRAVGDAQVAAFRTVRAGVAPEAVDAAARDHLAQQGWAEAFSHGTGHGLGLEVHEAPRLTRARPGHAEPALQAGMVLTLEPGVYLAGWGGVRTEDDVLVTDEGAEWLTDVPKVTS